MGNRYLKQILFVAALVGMANVGGAQEGAGRPAARPQYQRDTPAAEAAVPEVREARPESSGMSAPTPGERAVAAPAPAPERTRPLAGQPSHPPSVRPLGSKLIPVRPLLRPQLPGPPPPPPPERSLSAAGVVADPGHPAALAPTPTSRRVTRARPAR